MINKPTINQNPIKVKRALVSVYDKTGIVTLAKKLINLGVEILSTGGTANLLKKEKVQVTDVSDYTNFPEIMDGRVKTINPLIEGGILGLRDKHDDEAKINNIKWIDLVICNLYPFSDVVTQQDCDLAIALENIDIGGPTMVRSAAKNCGWVCVGTSPNDYKAITDELIEDGKISYNTRRELSAKAFGHTATYDTIIHNYLKQSKFSENFSLTFTKHSDMRYGENPHQGAAAYQIPNDDSNNILNARIHQGKKLSYNNIMDSDGALACIKEFDKPSCVIVKHANPCGVATGESILDCYNRAFNSDPISAFGGIIVLNRACSLEIAEEISKVFVEIVIAPGFDSFALSLFKKKKNLRILEIKPITKRKSKLEIRNIDGGILAQEVDIKSLTFKDLEIVTNRKPSKKDIENALFSWKVLRHAKSNGILIAKDNVTVGLGAGQVSRVDAVHMAIRKGGENLQGSSLASDAFFPFRDSVDALSKTGVQTIIQPGGSIRDKEVVEACNEHDIAMVFTGTRCFKH
jgi:phosphoribosylaminoimidazolecarboxamide formyltransferase / IMP cyclohydrolase